jgi:phenylalanyl-tRNA synthetase beta chain
LPGGLEIKQSIIRGEASSGMICAEDELGLGSDREGIMVLNKKTKTRRAFF